MLRLGFDYLEPLFTADSGNDIYVSSSRISSVQVAKEDTLDAAIKYVRASRRGCTLI